MIEKQRTEKAKKTLPRKPHQNLCYINHSSY